MVDLNEFCLFVQNSAVEFCLFVKDIFEKHCIYQRLRDILISKYRLGGESCGDEKKGI